jgi:serine phosphatase RsbU (regulator of sigma subunit)
MSETLQRSLLSAPAQPDDLAVAVRYRPALQEAQVGGDWYDSFLTSKGILSLVVGDIAGHDQHAAAVMGQARNLLRGVAYTLAQPPAAILSTLDRAMRDLEVTTYATVLLANVVQTGEQAAAGLRTLRWSNAGHPPPVLLRADGTATLLQTAPNLLLGVDPGVRRDDHDVVLHPGDLVLLYTDGLIERRGTDLDEGLSWLTTTVAALAALDHEQLCDALLELVAGQAEDDVALLALRAG